VISEVIDGSLDWKAYARKLAADRRAVMERAT
jgi:hypothetical protein